MEPEQAERGYLRAVHYFADAGIAKFWTAFAGAPSPPISSGSANDGFDTIILVVPWASFQPTIDPPCTSFVHLERLRWLIRQATENGLKVALRLGYEQVVLNRLVALAAPAWKGIDLRFEHRLDGDRWVDDEGTDHWYQQSLIRPGARGDLVYYHPDLRTSGHGKRRRAAALLHLEETVLPVPVAGVERPFVDQFNFELNNPELPDFSSTHEEHLPDLISAAAPLFALLTERRSARRPPRLDIWFSAVRG